MLSLVLKDLMVQKKNLIAVLIYPLVGIMAFGSSFSSSAAYIFSIVSIGYMLVITADGYDDKSKFDIVLNSLPLRRKDSVIAKYLTVGVYFVLGVFLVVFEGTLIRSTGLFSFLQPIKASDIFIGAVALCLYYAVYFPLNYKFGAIKMRYINIFIYMFFTFVPLFCTSLVKENPDDARVQAILNFIRNLPALGMKSISFAIVIILFILSMNLSINIYKNKDF